MLTLTLTLLVQLAAAQENPNDLVTTPFGQMRNYTIQGLCQAERIYIADITDVESYEVTFSQRETIQSDVELTIRAPLRGTFPSKVYIEQVFGGRIGDRTVRAFHTPVQPHIGKRYLLGQSHYFDHSGQRRWGVMASVEVDASAEIPEDIRQQFEQYFADACAPQSGAE